MRRIHKYYLTVQDEPQQIELPKQAKVLAVGEQYGTTIVWVEFDTKFEDERTMRTFQVVGTGWDFEEGAEYCGTVQMKTGFVWHIYERLY